MKITRALLTIAVSTTLTIGLTPAVAAPVPVAGTTSTTPAPSAGNLTPVKKTATKAHATRVRVATTERVPLAHVAPAVSTSKKGVRPSAYVGPKYNPRHEKTRRCIVARESSGYYTVSNPSGKYRGAYQMNSGLARAAARKMGRPDLVNKPIDTWSRFAQDRAFWTIWDHGRGRSHWAGGRWHC
jgi:hypothetical protein